MNRSSIIAEYGDDKGAFLKKVQEIAINPPLLSSTSGKATCEARCKAEVEAIVARCKVRTANVVTSAPVNPCPPLPALVNPCQVAGTKHTDPVLTRC